MAQGQVLQKRGVYDEAIAMPRVDLRARPVAARVASAVPEIDGERVAVCLLTSGSTGAPQPQMTGCHQPSERFHGTIIPFAWFAQGLRLVDIADPFAPKEVGFYEPDVAPGRGRTCSNDVTLDRRGIAYLTDRLGGVHVIECFPT